MFRKFSSEGKVMIWSAITFVGSIVMTILTFHSSADVLFAWIAVFSVIVFVIAAFYAVMISVWRVTNRMAGNSTPYYRKKSENARDDDIYIPPASKRPR